jgi:hypothetical protein
VSENVNVRGRMVGVLMVCSRVGVVSGIVTETDSVESCVCTVQCYVHDSYATVSTVEAAERMESGDRSEDCPQGWEPEAQDTPVSAQGQFIAIDWIAAAVADIICVTGGI